MEWVTSKDTLESMSHLSLRRRAHLVREKFGLAKLTHQTLHKYYTRYGVKYKRPDYKFWKSNAENLHLKNKQLEFVKLLGTFIHQRAYDEIVYVDETTFNLW